MTDGTADDADDADDAADDAEWGLVEKFIVTSSAGGPFDDNSFVAGIYYGILEAAFDSGHVPEARYVPEKLTPQLELLALRYGYVARYPLPGLAEADGWTSIDFREPKAVRFNNDEV